ncbi:MAG: 50S ribosomal protein L29 [Planctomycetota bacterium]
MNKAIEEIRGTDTSDLKAKLADLRKEQFELRFQGAGEGASTNRQRVLRRTVARIMTVIGDRERQEQKGQVPAGDKKA